MQSALMQYHEIRKKKPALLNLKTFQLFFIDLHIIHQLSKNTVNKWEIQDSLSKSINIHYYLSYKHLISFNIM